MTPIQSCFAFLILFCKLYLFFVDLLLKILEEWKEESSNEDKQKERRLLLHICPFHWLYMCVNPLNPKRNQNLISPYSNTAESFIKIMRIKEMITHRYEALITKRILLHIDVRVLRLNGVMSRAARTVQSIHKVSYSGILWNSNSRLWDNILLLFTIKSTKPSSYVQQNPRGSMTF